MLCPSGPTVPYVGDGHGAGLDLGLQEDWAGVHDVGAGQVLGTGLEMICGLGLLLQGDQVQVCPVCGWVWR